MVLQEYAASRLSTLKGNARNLLQL